MGSPQPGGTSLGLDIDARTDGIAGLAQRIHIFLKRGHLRRMRPEERILVPRRSSRNPRDDIADLRQITAHPTP
jgi:hypothetical protein